MSTTRHHSGAPVPGLFLVLLAAVLSACGTGGGDGGGTATVEGRVTDEEGYQPQRLGGEGSVSATASVRVSAIAPGGALEALAEAEVSADGSYAVDVPADQERLVVEALDEAGAVVAAAILEASGAAGETTTCTPMDSESSLEARVLVEMIDAGAPVDEVNPVDLRARITSRLAGAVAARERAGADVEAAVRALAEAVRAAQLAELRAYADMGLTTSQAALFEAELAASQALSATLHDGSKSATDAYDAFFAALDEAAADAGAEAEERARAESCAGMSFRATAEARLEVDGEGAV